MWGWEEAEQALKASNALELPPRVQEMIQEETSKEQAAASEGDDRTSLFQKGVGGADDWMVLHWMPLGSAGLGLEEPPAFLPAEVILEPSDIFSPYPPALEGEGGSEAGSDEEEEEVEEEAPTGQEASAMDKDDAVASVTPHELTKEVERILQGSGAEPLLLMPSGVAATKTWSVSQWEEVMSPIMASNRREKTQRHQHIARLIRVSGVAGVEGLGEWALRRALPGYLQDLASAGVTDVTSTWGLQAVAAFVDDVIRWSALGSLPPAKFKAQLQGLGLRRVGDVGASLEALIAEAYFHRRQ